MPTKKSARARAIVKRHRARRTAQLARRRKAQQAIVRVAPAPIKAWMLSNDEVAILKNAICKGANDDEMKYCLTVARRYELDPFQQQIWFVPRWDSEAIMADGKKGGKVYVPQVSMNGLLNLAARDHKDFGSYSEPEYGPMIDVTYRVKGQGPQLKLRVPEWARIGTLKKGSTEPTVARLWWEEIYPDIDFAPLVRRMPRLMLAKCAKANATRTAYPKTGGLLIPEETYNKEFTQFTPEGRVYSEEKPDEALERYKLKEAAEINKLTPAQKEIVERRMKEAEERKNPTTDGATGQLKTVSDRVESQSTNDRSRPQPIETLEIHWPSDAAEFVHLRGTALTVLLPYLKKECEAAWEDEPKCWIVPVSHVAAIKKVCPDMRIKVTESSVSQPPVSTDAGKTPASGSAPASAAVRSSAGFVLDVRMGKTSNKAVPFMDVKQGGTWRSTYVKPLFEFLEQTKGKDCVFICDEKQKIIGIKRIGNREFEADGRTPIIQNQEFRPSKTADLFKENQ